MLTGSNAAAGLVFFVLALAGLAAPLGGLVVDRLPKRRLMIVTHLAMAAMVCLLLFVNDRSDLWLIYVVAALYGLGGDLFAAARSAMLKAMLPDELLGEANGILQSVREGLRLVAPLAGAGIFAAFGGAAVALVDAGSFVLSAVTLVLLRFVEPAVRRARAVPARGLRRRPAHRAHRMLRELTIGICAVMLVAGFSETIIFALTRRAAPAAVVHRRDRDVPGHRRDRRRADGADADAAPGRRPSRRTRHRAVRRRRHALARPPPAGRLPGDGGRGRGHRMGGRRAGDCVSAAQPDRGAGPRQRGREHALQRAADDLDRDRRCADHRRSTTGC